MHIVHTYCAYRAYISFTRVVAVWVTVLADIASEALPLHSPELQAGPDVQQALSLDLKTENLIERHAGLTLNLKPSRALQTFRTMQSSTLKRAKS